MIPDSEKRLNRTRAQFFNIKSMVAHYMYDATEVCQGITHNSVDFTLLPISVNGCTAKLIRKI